MFSPSALTGLARPTAPAIQAPAPASAPVSTALRVGDLRSGWAVIGASSVCAEVGVSHMMPAANRRADAECPARGTTTGPGAAPRGGPLFAWRFHTRWGVG